MMWGAGPGPWWALSVLGVLVVVAFAGVMAWMFWARPARGRFRHYGPPVVQCPPGDARAIAPSPPSGDIRVSNAERDEVIEQLRHHLGEGRLTMDEFEARVGEATEAKTASQLQRLIRDLPVLPAPARRRR